MEVYLARQPIFNRNMSVYGYELLYRRSMNNFYEGINGNMATAEVINNAFLTMKIKEISNGTKAFINFSADLLINEIPFLMPKEQVVIEILEQVEPTQIIIDVCKRLKEHGYLIALDDFAFKPNYQALVELADIIKVEFKVDSLSQQKIFINQHRNKIKFLAEKVETRTDYEIAHKLGYDYFQGYFFSKPIIMKATQTPSINQTLVQVAKEIMDDEFDYQKLAILIEKDVGLSYKLLKLVNTVGFGSRYQIYSIKQALARLGIKEIRKWIYIMMLQGMHSVEISELVNLCVIRAKFMESLAKSLGLAGRHLELFLVGLFSCIDIIMNRPMQEMVDDLALTEEVRDALLGKPNELHKILVQVISFERGQQVNNGSESVNIKVSEWTELYVDAIGWAGNLID
ncbi:EAL and HDOD domain-containing protein [Desulfuribacillus alkaliarsenatis]|uniref:EAL domain-containing protein n=1 Tax=Desulfuribacillus alkaliarsenatis TaxID=766136 RepID=A0A1E5G186_9FIRM|nr:HDOD domain-containing protein [Desulfuribacillus alkaliarsenatis]OEF96621.1 hypothetical protein BHF68_08235 [Desulfuribacillus alkaliarsenatis]